MAPLFNFQDFPKNFGLIPALLLCTHGHDGAASKAQELPSFLKVGGFLAALETDHPSLSHKSRAMVT